MVDSESREGGSRATWDASVPAVTAHGGCDEGQRKAGMTAAYTRDCLLNVLS